MTNPEGFIALGGHAAAVSRAARRLADDETRLGHVWREVPDEFVPAGPSRRERLLTLLNWSGDRLIAVGAWLKTLSRQPGYQDA